MKEFADFESSNTPTFRHPPIKGSVELEEVGLMEELRTLEMVLTSEEMGKVNILQPHEQLNIDIPSNRDIVRNYYIDQMFRQKRDTKQAGDLEKPQLYGFLDIDHP
jgi:hypothetical protein